MFRASPWVTYDPSSDAATPASHSFSHSPAMASEDVEMDAPQISTLREDETPEPDPAPARTTKFRVKLLVGEGKASSSSSKTQASQPESEDDDEDDDEDDEEDQLIDDEDEQEVKAPTPSPAVSAAPSTRGTPVKRGGAGRGRGGRKRGAKAGVTISPPDLASATVPAASASAPPAPASKKRGGGTGVGRGRGGGRKRGTPAKTGWETRLNLDLLGKAKSASSLLRDDADSVSEAYAATAASSPMPQDDHSPDPDIGTAPIIPPPVVTDMNVDIENVPLPVYPLPSRPFAVQPPPKIGTGFAPVVHIDKTRKPVRRWRQAQREVRGIAGGRWFVKSWLGDKESDYASATTSNAQHPPEMSGPPNLVLPKLSGPAISGSISGKATPKGRGSGLKMDTTAMSSAFSSRDVSAAPADSISAGPPTKKRNLGPLLMPTPDAQVDTPAVSTPNGIS